MWRWLLAFVGVLSVAVASSYLVGEKGYVLIAMGNWTVESTVVGMVILLVTLLMVFWLIKKLLQAGFDLTKLGWHKITFAGKNKANKQLHQGVASYLLGDYQQAEQLLQISSQHCQVPQLALLLAADAANQSQQPSHVEHYLAQLASIRQQSAVTPKLLAVEIALLTNQNRFEQARNLLDANHTLIGHDPQLALVAIKVLLHEQRFEQAVQSLQLLSKQKAITAEQLKPYLTVVYQGYFSQVITNQDSEALVSAWQALPKKDKQNPQIILSYCQVLAQNGLTELLQQQIVALVKSKPSNALLKQLKLLPLQHCQQLLTLIQQQLQQQPLQADWLALLAHLAWHLNDLELAQKAFVELKQLQDYQFDSQDRLVYSRVLIGQQKYQAATTLLLEK